MTIDMQKLSETKEAKTWILQFNLKDEQETAKLLIDSIILVSYSDIKNTMRKLIEDSLVESKTICLLAAREDINKMKKSSYKQLMEMYTNHDEKQEVDYWNNDKDFLPPKDNPWNVGSEGLFCKLIRDLCKENKLLLDHPSIHIMEKRKCKHILILDDISGSGKRLNDFINWITRNKTIKSWLSYGIIDISVCLYALTEEANKELSKNKKIKKIFYTQYINQKTFFKNDNEYLKIRDLCMKYEKLIHTKQEDGPELQLGFGNSLSLLVFDYGCPNNAPYILWGKSQTELPWIPLFNSRNNKFDLNEITSVISQPIEISVKYEHNLIMLLSLISKRKFSYSLYTSYLHVNIYVIRDWLQKLLDLQWIKPNYRITEHGRLILRKLKKEKEDTDQLEDNNTIYYLKS